MLFFLNTSVHYGRRTNYFNYKRNILKKMETTLFKKMKINPPDITN